MTIQDANKGPAVGFLDPECPCSTMLNSTNNTLAFSMSFMLRLSQYEPLDCSGDRSEAAEGLLS
jgi:hypothetical protein